MMVEFKQGAVLTLGTLLVAFLGMFPCSSGRAEATIIKGIRTGSELAYVRVVIESDVRLEPRPKITVNRNTLRISLTGIGNDPSELKSEALRDDVVNIDVISTSAETRIEAILAFVPTKIRTFFLITPHRFVIDAYRPSSGSTKAPSDEVQRPITIIEENDTRSDDANPPATSPHKELGESKEPNRPSAITESSTEGSDSNRFQQRLLVFLIVVTSIILVVIIFLMCMDKQQK